MWRKKRVIFAAITALAVLSVVFPYYNQTMLFLAFAPHHNQNTLVLDAGHGGIVGIRTVLTRTDPNSLQYDPNQTVRHNKIQDIHARETRTNQTQNPIFISVHLNKFSDSRYTGAQTFWSKNNPEGQLLAQSIQEQLTNGLHPEKQRTAKQAPDSVYLMKHLTCPAMIVECGFLSNREETERLKQDGYQKKLSVCVINGYLNYLEG